MEWKPNRADKTPVYKQIADYIERGISSGEFPSDSKLPSERMLAKELQVNRSTIVAAYEELKSLGVVERQREAEHGSIQTYGVSHINEYRTGVGTWRMDRSYLTYHSFNKFERKHKR